MPVVSSAAVAAAIAAQVHAGDDGMAKVEERIEKLKAENLAQHRQLIAKKAMNARAFMDK